MYIKHLPKVLAYACSTVLIWLAGVRYTQVTAAEKRGPGVSETSGFEDESWFAICNESLGLGAYQNPHAVPFSAAYFNLLFYKIYACAIGIVRGLYPQTSFIDIARQITFSGLLAFCLVLFLGLRILGGPEIPWAVLLGLALYAGAGPLIGWWSLTVRPDMWALAAETTGCICFIHSGRRPKCLIFAVSSFFLAWAFKPTYVFALGSAVATSLWFREWRNAFWMVCGVGLLCTLTLILGGGAYRSALFHTASVNVFSFWVMLDNLKGALEKLAPTFLGIALAIGGGVISGREFFRNRTNFFISVGCLASFCLGTMLAGKVGASTNYFFTSAGFVSFLFAVVLRNSRVLYRGIAAGIFSLAAIGVGLIWYSSSNHFDLQKLAATQARIWERWKCSPEPRFSEFLPFDMPWLNPNTKCVLPAFNYPLERARGVRFDGNGVGGMIERGEFKSILLYRSSSGGYDGAPLRKYSIDWVDGDYTAYRRMDF